MVAGSSTPIACSSSDPQVSYFPGPPSSSSVGVIPRRKIINPLALSILPNALSRTTLRTSRSSSSSGDDNQQSPDSSEGKGSLAVASVLSLAHKVFVETRPFLIQKELPHGRSFQDYIRTHFIPVKSLSKKPKKVIKLLQSVHEYVVGQAVYIEAEHIIPEIIKNEHLCILKESYPSIRRTTAEFFNKFPGTSVEPTTSSKKIRRSMKSEDKSTETFVKHFNRYDKLREEYIEKAIDALIKIKEESWEYKNGVKVSPISDAVPGARKAFFEMYFCDDLDIKEMALHYLIEILECDPLTKRSADELIDLQAKLLAEINQNKVQSRTISIQRLLIKAYGISLECILLHSGLRHLNGIIDEFKHQIWAGAENLSDLNVNDDEEIKFWTAYAIQGAQRIKTNVSLLQDMFSRLFLVVKAGLRIASAINSPQEGGAALSDAYEHLSQAIWHIRWLKDWFDLVMMAKKLCRYSMHDVQAFRQVIDFVQQIKREETGYKLFYGIVSGLEYVISKTIHQEIREEGLKLLLQYMTVDNLEIKERIVLAFAHVVEFNEQGGKLQNTAYILLKILESTEEDMSPIIQSLIASLPPSIMRNLEHQKKVFEQTGGDINSYLYVNVVKFLIRRLAEIKDEEDFGGHSFVTLLSSSNEDRITPALLTGLKLISLDFLRPDDHGNTPYHVSVRKRNPSMIDYISKSLPEISMSSQDFQNHNTALHVAVEVGDENLVKQLIKLGADLNIQNIRGDTPLHLATGHRFYSIAKLLLDGDINVNLVNNNGETPLNIAIKYDCVEFVDLLITRGGCVAEGQYRCTPIMIAGQAHAEKTCMDLIKKAQYRLSLLECFEILKLISNDRKNLTCSIEFAEYHYGLITTNKDYEESFKPLCFWPKLAVNEQNQVYLKVETQVTRCQIFENSILIQLVTGDHSIKDIKSHIKQNPEQINQPNKLLITPLHGAVSNHNHEAVQLLLDKGAEVNVADARGFTPLHMAVFVNDSIMVKMLLEARADPNARNDYGDTPFLLYAGNIPSRVPSNIHTVLPNIVKIEDKTNDIPELLIRYGAHTHACDILGNYALHHALLYGTPDSIFYIMNSYSDLLCKSDKIWIGEKMITPLEEAALAEKRDSIKALFDMLSDEDLHLIEEEFYHNDNISVTIGNILAMIDDAENFERLVRKKPAVAYRSDKSSEKLTPIHIAGKKNRVNILGVYLNSGLKLDTPDGFNNTIAHHAAEHGNSEIIRELVSVRKFDFNAKNFDARTALHISAINNRFDIFELIFDINPKAAIEKDGGGETPLHLACRKSHFEIAKLIVDRYPSAIDSINDNGNTSIHLAAATDPTCKTLHYLLNKISRRGESASLSTHVDTKNAFGQTPLLLASQQGHLVAVDLLCTRGADILAQDDEKESALHKAVFNNHFEVVRELLIQDQYVSDERKLIRQKDIRSEIPLHEIAKKKCSDSEIDRKNAILRLLLDAGSDLQAKNETGETVLHSIGSYGMKGLLRTLSDRLLETKNKLNFNIKDSHGDTILHKACYNNHNEIIPLILDLKVNINGKNNKGQTPLHIAIEQNHIDLAKSLISLGARLSIKDHSGKSILHYILKQQSLSKQNLNLLRQLLIRKPSLVNSIDANEETIFHYIAKYNHIDAYEVIISTLFRGYAPLSALLWKTNRDGQAPYDIARDQGHVVLRQKIQSFHDELLTPSPDEAKSSKCILM